MRRGGGEVTRGGEAGRGGAEVRTAHSNLPHHALAPCLAASREPDHVARHLRSRQPDDGVIVDGLRSGRLRQPQPHHAIDLADATATAAAAGVHAGVRAESAADARGFRGGRDVSFRYPVRSPIAVSSALFSVAVAVRSVDVAVRSVAVRSGAVCLLDVGRLIAVRCLSVAVRCAGRGCRRELSAECCFVCCGHGERMEACDWAGGTGVWGDRGWGERG